MNVGCCFDRFGTCAKQIKNKAKVNVTRSLREVIDSLDAAQKTITRQNKVIASLEATIEQYRAVLRANGLPDDVAVPDMAAVGRMASSAAAPPVTAAAKLVALSAPQASPADSPDPSRSPGTYDVTCVC